MSQIDSAFEDNLQATQSPPGSGDKSPFWGPWITTGFGFAIFFVHSITQIVTVAIYGVVLLIISPQKDISLLISAVESELGLILSFAIIASSIVGTVFIILVIKLRRSVSVAEYLGFRVTTLKTLLISLAVAVGFLLLSEAFSLIPGYSSNNDFQINIYKTSIWPPLFFIAVVLVAPVFEEILFRGFWFEGFRESRIKIVGAILFTSLLWTLLHVQYNIWGMTSIFILGLIIGIVRYRTNSLWCCMLIHIVVNLAAMIQTAYVVGDSST